MALSNLKISTRLALGFATLTALIVVLGVITLVQSERMEASVEFIMKSRFPVYVDVTKAQDGVNDQARYIRNLVLMTTPAGLNSNVRR